MIFKNRVSDPTDPKEEEEKKTYTYKQGERSHLAQCFCSKTGWLESEYTEKKEGPSKA